MKKSEENTEGCSYQCEGDRHTEKRKNEMHRGVDRREFLMEGTAALVGAGFLLKEDLMPKRGSTKLQTSSDPGVIPGPWQGKVIELTNPDVIKQRRINQQIVGEMIERGLKELTGKNSLAESWSLFVQPEDIVGIKLNCLGGPLCSTSKEVVDEIIGGIKLAGVKEDNIIVWDRRQYHMENCGYQIKRSGPGVKYYGPEETRVGQEDMNGYDSDTFIESDIKGRSIPNILKKTSTRSYFVEIMSRKITKLINVPVLKDHGSAGVTLCLKNLGFGLVNNTARFHPAPYYCAPIMPLVMNHPATKSKTVLHIVDAINGVWDKGPRARADYVWHYKSIMIGTDPVAIDRMGYDILEAKREEMGASAIGNRALHIAECGRAGLGISNLSKIQHSKITL